MIISGVQIALKLSSKMFPFQRSRAVGKHHLLTGAEGLDCNQISPAVFGDLSAVWICDSDSHPSRQDGWIQSNGICLALNIFFLVETEHHLWRKSAVRRTDVGNR